MKTKCLVVWLCVWLGGLAAAAAGMFDLPPGTWSHHDDPRHTFSIEFGPHHAMTMSYVEHSLDGSGQLARGEYHVLATKCGDWHATFKVKAVALTGYTPPGQSRSLQEVSILGLTLRPGDEVSLFLTHAADKPSTLQVTAFDSLQEPIFSRVVTEGTP